MSKRIMCSLVTMLVLFLPMSGVFAEMLPQGVTMVVLKEAPAPHLPGVAMTRLVELRMAPGSEWPHEIMESGFCTALKGNITVEVGGKTVTKFVGDSWVMKKGKTVKAFNRGTVEHVQHMWLLIEG